MLLGGARNQTANLAILLLEPLIYGRAPPTVRLNQAFLHSSREALQAITGVLATSFIPFVCIYICRSL